MPVISQIPLLTPIDVDDINVHSMSAISGELERYLSSIGRPRRVLVPGRVRCQPLQPGPIRVDEIDVRISISL